MSCNSTKTVTPTTAPSNSNNNNNNNNSKNDEKKNNSELSMEERLIRKLSKFKSEFKEWEKSCCKSEEKDSWKYIISCDVGATNFRMSILILSKLKDGTFIEKYLNVILFECTCASVLIQNTALVAQHLVTQVFEGKTAEAGVLAAAGPVSANGKQVHLTNYVGEKNLRIEQLPASFFPHEHSRFLNDLEAGCYGILTSGLDGILGDYFAEAFPEKTKDTSKVDDDNDDKKKKIKLQNYHYAVLAMGTGLGCGLLMSITYKQSKFEKNPTFDVIPLEAGHLTIPYPNSVTADVTKEVARIEYIGKTVYDSKHGIEIEDICSGRGLKYCYSYETQGKQSLEAPQIALEAQKGNDAASNALLVHYRYLMKAAQNICIMLPSCKGVFLMGDNQVTNNEFFSKHANLMQQEFLYHPKKSWLETVKIYKQINILNMNVRGAFYYAKTYLL